MLLRATAEHSASLPEHMLEVGELSRNVARRLGLDAETVELTLRAGELHDVGKIAIPESILSKPGPLSDTEWAFVRNHTLIGERVLNAAPALEPVAKLVRSTHERYDGAGYPDGLSGEQIPLPSRIVFACDAFHAMIAARPYAPGMSETDARAELSALRRQPVRPTRHRRAPRRTRPTIRPAAPTTGGRTARANRSRRPIPQHPRPARRVNRAGQARGCVRS